MNLKTFSNYQYLKLSGVLLFCILHLACITDSTIESASKSALQTQSITEEENKALINRWIEARNSQFVKNGK